MHMNGHQNAHILFRSSVGSEDLALRSNGTCRFLIDASLKIKSNFSCLMDTVPPIRFSHMTRRNVCRTLEIIKWSIRDRTRDLSPSELHYFFRQVEMSVKDTANAQTSAPTIKSPAKLLGWVISPFLTGCVHRTYAAIFNFMAGVMPPMPMLGRSLL